MTPELAPGTAGKIIDQLRQGPMAIEELAHALGLTRTAVRAHLTTLMTRGIVEPRGARKGPSKPTMLYALTGAAEQQLSRAYVPVLTTLLQHLSTRLSPAEFSSIMREVGRSLGARFPAKGEVRERVERVNALLHQLGGLTTVSDEGENLVILGQGCPLSAATATLPEACGIVGSLIAEVTGRTVRTRCEEYGRKRCCFEVTKGAA